MLNFVQNATNIFHNQTFFFFVFRKPKMKGIISEDKADDKDEPKIETSKTSRKVHLQAVFMIYTTLTDLLFVYLKPLIYPSFVYFIIAEG